MGKHKPQIIRDGKGRPAYAVLPWADYVDLLAEESMSDEELFDLAEVANEERLPDEVVDKLLAGENPVRVFRRYRDMTQDELARKAGTNPVYISQIERGSRRGSLDLNRRLAAALDVDIDDLVAAPAAEE
jgi:DNA-binding XRE family transcriptional regulator